MNVLSTTLEFAEVANGWRGLLDGDLKLSGKQAAIVAEGIDCWRSLPGFTGAEEREMREILAHGYKVPGMKIKGSNTRARRKLRFSEEQGDLQWDRVEAGEDAIFMERTPRRNAVKSLKLEVELAVRASTPASVLTDYAKWLGKLVTGLEGAGFELQIDVVSRCKALVAEGQLDTHIRVKSFGKRGSKRSWSALLSPGGFRHLVFAARILAAEKLGVQAKPGFGASFGPSWDLKFDRKSRRLTVQCAAMTQRFPVEEMDRKLAQIKF